MSKKINILLTNDDGIHADGLLALYRSFKSWANVMIVAPDGERSSVSHGITLKEPLTYSAVHQNGRIYGYAVNGKTADCVKLALDKICPQKPDMLISGINLGKNEGCSVIYSGTVAGAREGALNHIPSIAISLDTFRDPQYQVAAEWSLKLAKNFFKVGIPEKTFLNVNIPHQPKSKIKGIKLCRQGLIPIHSQFKTIKAPNDKTYYWLTGGYRVPRYDDQSDTYALAQNHITVVPIQTDTTDYQFINQIENLSLFQ